MRPRWQEKAASSPSSWASHLTAPNPGPFAQQQIDEAIDFNGPCVFNWSLGSRDTNLVRSIFIQGPTMRGKLIPEMGYSTHVDDAIDDALPPNLEYSAQSMKVTAGLGG